MDEAEKCDEINLMNKGTLIYSGKPTEFKKSIGEK